MTHQQHLQASDNDALCAHDLLPPSLFGQHLFSSRRFCPVAIISLVCGILAWLAIPIIGAVAAVILGHAARRQIGHSDGMVSGDGMAIAGLVLGYAQLFIIALLLGVTHLPPSIG